MAAACNRVLPALKKSFAVLESVADTSFKTGDKLQTEK